MEINSWDIYWITRLDQVNGLAQALVVLALCGAIVIGCVALALEDFPPLLRRSLILCSVVFACAATVGTFTPTTKEMAAIMIVPKIINSEAAQELPGDLVGLAREWLHDLKPEKDE